MVASECAEHRGAPILVRPDADDETDPERLTQTYLQQVNVNRDFRVLADFFAGLRYHIVPQLVREPNRSIGHRNEPFGGDFLTVSYCVPETPSHLASSLLRAGGCQTMRRRTDRKSEHPGACDPHGQRRRLA